MQLIVQVIGGQTAGSTLYADTVLAWFCCQNWALVCLFKVERGDFRTFLHLGRDDEIPRPAPAARGLFFLVLDAGFGTYQDFRKLTVSRTPRSNNLRGGDFFAQHFSNGAKRDRLVLSSMDLDLPFPAHNPELLRMLTPALTSAVDDIERHANLGDRVKAILKLMMADARADVAQVARELCVSPRTLQRNISAEGKTFRTLLTEARHELSRELLFDGSIEVKEVAYRLGYQDTNSFYRAFRDQEKVTPGHWRRLNR